MLRTDFNADNTKVDAALTAQQAALTTEQTARQEGVAAAQQLAQAAADAVAAMPYVKIMDVTTTAQVGQIDLDVSSIDLTAYLKLELFVDNHATGTSPTTLRLNDTSNGYVMSTATSNNYTSSSSLASWSAVSDGMGQSVLLQFASPATGAEVACHYMCITKKGSLSTFQYSSADAVAQSITWDAVTSFNISHSAMPVGTRILLCGVRK